MIIPYEFQGDNPKRRDELCVERVECLHDNGTNGSQRA